MKSASLPLLVFVICRLHFSALSCAGFGRQAIVKNSLPALEKAPGAGRQVADNKSIIGDDPGSIAIFSLRFPVRQGKSVIMDSALRYVHTEHVCPTLRERRSRPESIPGRGFRCGAESGRTAR